MWIVALKGRYDDNAKAPLLAVVANVLAGCNRFIHLMFGMIIFSSIVSTVFCRIGGLREVASKD